MQKTIGMFVAFKNISAFLIGKNRPRYKAFTVIYAVVSSVPFFGKVLKKLVFSGISQNQFRFLWKIGVLHGLIRSCGPAERLEMVHRFFLEELFRDNGSDVLRSKCLALLNDGYIKLKNAVSDEDVRVLITELEKLQKRSGQVWSQSVSHKAEEGFFCWNPIDVIDNQKIINILKKLEIFQLLHEIKANDFGIYSVNAYGAYAGSGGHYVQKFHRDFDGFLTFSVMLLLSDASPGNGATELDLQSLGSPEGNLFMSGKAGDLFIFDTFNLHRANNNLSSDRQLIWLRFGEFPNGGVAQDVGWRVAQRFIDTE